MSDRTHSGELHRWRSHHADIAQLVERNLAKVEVAGSSPVVRSEASGLHRELAFSVEVCGPHGGVAERRGNGLQSRVHGFKSRLHLATRGSTSRESSRAIGAVVARFLDTEEVTGSNPVSPTSTKQPLTCGDASQGLLHHPGRVAHVSFPAWSMPFWRCQSSGMSSSQRPDGDGSAETCFR